MNKGKLHIIVSLVILTIASLHTSAQMSRHILQSRQFSELYVKGPVNVACRNNPDSAGLIVFNCTQEILPSIKCNNTGAILSISAENINSLTAKQQLSTIIIYYTNQLSTIAYTGSGMLSLDNPPLSHRVAIAMTGSGRIKASEVKTHFLNCAMSGSGSIAMSGQTSIDNITCSVSGSGAIEIADIKADNTNATVKGPGDMIINGRSRRASFALKGSGVIDASALSVNSLTAGAYGSGKIYYNHNVSEVNTSGKRDNIIKR